MDFLVKISVFILALLLTNLQTNNTNIQAQNYSPEDFLRGQNAARAQVGVEPLVWNQTVASYAETYANQRAIDCALEHSTIGPYGENIAEGGNEFSGSDAVNMWVGEKPFYDYDSNSCVGGAGADGCLHYTQVVWRDSVHLGCARVKCANNGWWFITCNYDPPGNFVGQHPY